MKPHFEATVVSFTRRWVEILRDDLTRARARSLGTALDPAVGDRVRCSTQDNDIVISEILPRRNEITRSSGVRSKTLVANVDRLLVVTAIGPLLNPIFIDRALVAAHAYGVAAELVVNKTDLSPDESEALLEPYAPLDIPIRRCSASTGDGLDSLRTALDDPALALVALCGLSGVGKSSLMNRLLPEVDQRVGEVSRRTGQGRQTTTQAFAYLYPRGAAAPLLIVDPPGFQQFGLAHLTPQLVAEAYPEIRAAKSGCAFPDCRHRNEQVCEVRARVERREIAEARYRSYCEILDEIEAARPY